MLKMVGDGGLEPPTSSLSVTRSNLAELIAQIRTYAIVLKLPLFCNQLLNKKTPCPGIFGLKTK